MDKLSEDVKRAIGARLKEIRKHFSLNQEDFAKRIKNRQTTLSRYENGEYEIPDYLKVFLFDDLSVNINWLLTGKGKMFISNEELNHYTAEELFSIAKDVAVLYKTDKEKFNKLVDTVKEKESW